MCADESVEALLGAFHEFLHFSVDLKDELLDGWQRGRVGMRRAEVNLVVRQRRERELVHAQCWGAIHA